MNLFKNISTKFFLSLFVFIIISFIFPTNSANAVTPSPLSGQVICGYDSESHVEIFCDYTISITDQSPLVDNSQIHANFYIGGSSYDNLIGAPSLIYFNDISNGTTYVQSCGVGNNNCTVANTNANVKAGSANNKHSFNVYFKWDTSYGVYEYKKTLEYLVGPNPTGDVRDFVNISADKVDVETDDTVSISWAGTVNGGPVTCELYKVNSTGTPTSNVLSSTSPYTALITNTQRFEVKCPVKSSVRNDIYIHVVPVAPLTNPTVSLIKQEDKIKNLVKKNDSNAIGSAYFRINMNEVPSGSCILKNTADLSYSVTYNNSNQFQPKTVNSIIPADNSYWLDCPGELLDTNPIDNIVKTQSGTLTVPSECTIPVGGSSCTNVSVTWNTVNPRTIPTTTNTSLYLDNVYTNYSGNGQVTQNITISGEGIPDGSTQRTATLETKNKVDGENGTLANPAVPVDNILASKTITVKCNTNSVWKTNVSPHRCVSTATIPLTSISINGSMVVGTNLTTTLVPGIANVTYKWQRDSDTGFVNIAGATSSTYTLTLSDLGKNIKVIATGINPYTGEVNNIKGPVTASTFALTVTKNVAAGGTISSSPAGINCDTTCTTRTASFNSGANVMLTALPSGNYKFTGWSGGGCSGTALTCSVSITEARNVNAFFSSGTISLSSDTCTIAYGADTCNAYITWSTQNRFPSALTAVTRNNPDNTSVSTAPSGTNVANAVRNGVSTYFLYHNSVLLNQVSITATKTYAVIFNSNGGTGTMANQEIVSGQSENLDNNQFTRTGYTFSNWATRADGGGTNYLDGASYTMGTADVTLYAQWTSVVQYSVNSIVSGGNGTISPTGQQLVPPNSQLQFIVTPNAGYKASVASGVGSCGGTLVDNTYTTNPITANCTVVASFLLMSGTLAPTGSASCSIPLNQSNCNINHLGWSIVNPIGIPTSITSNGLPNIDVTNTLTSPQSGIKQVNINHGKRIFYLYNNEVDLAQTEVEAVCGLGGWNGVKCSRHYVTPSEKNGSHGTITPSTVQTVNYGTKVDFTITPNNGYYSSVEGTCPLGTWSGNTYTTGTIIGDCTVIANYTNSVFTVTPSAGANGSISPNTVQTVAPNTTLTFTVTPSAGYTSSIEGTCPEGTWVGDKYTTGAITANCTVEASFLGMTGTLTPGPNTSCTIANGEDNCKIDLSWTTTNPIGTSAVTSPTGTPNPGNSVNNGTQTFTAPHNAFGVNFFLYNNGQKLAETNVATNCMPGSVWNGTTKVCEVEVPAGQPDLIAGNPYITTENNLNNMIIYSDIENKGNASTEPVTEVGFRSFIKKLFNIKNVFAGLSEGGGGEVIGSTGFYNLFQTSTNASNPDNPKEVIDYPITPEMAHILAGGSRTTQSPITEFKKDDWVRFCADKNSAGDIGVITEWNEFGTGEKNNCSDWVEVEKLSPLPPIGSILGDDCIIPENKSSCLTDVSWTSSNTTGMVTLVSGIKELGSGASGEVNESIPFSSRDFSLKDGEVVLVTKTIGANCVTGTTWTIDKCIKIIIVPPTYNIGLNASKGTIVKGGATVVRWDSVDGWASSCVASSTDNNWTGDKMTSGGSDPLHPLVTTTYTLTCEPTDDSPDVIENVTVKVIEPNVKEE